jgi:hypothetical protein
MYCKQPAGFLKSAHPECKQRYELGWQQIVAKATEAAKGKSPLPGIEGALAEIARTCYLDDSKVREALVAGWEAASASFLEDNLISEAEEETLANYAKECGLSQQDLMQHGAYMRVVKGSILREVFHGKTPSAVKVTGTMPFNVGKDEVMIWLEGSIKYMEERTHRTYVGGSQGVSMRIAKGLYYRVGAFKATPVVTSALEAVDQGNVLITDKALYFQGAIKSFRIPFKKMVSFLPYSDGLGFFRNTANAKQQVIVSGDGWFYYNLITNLAQR